MKAQTIALTAVFFAFTYVASAKAPNFSKQRAAMVENIRLHARSYTKELGKKGIASKVLEAMRQTKRHLFLPERYRKLAYADQAVSIGRGQTISQPFIVALMTHFANVKPDHAVLEVGTGSGYQAAILSKLAQKVCTIEIIPSLGKDAANRLRELGYQNVSVRVGDGYKGWSECGPFDAIIVTAALDHVPPPLIKQLKVGGRLVMPVGPVSGIQDLTVVDKTSPNHTKTRLVTPVRFVPFTRER